jgi:L-2,4-diaminobutyrate transaminase
LPVNSTHKVDLDHHLHPFTALPAFLRDGPSIITNASGFLVSDDQGRSFIDAAAGLWCVNVGYGREEIVEAAAAQMRRLSFFQTFNGVTNEAVAALSGRVTDLAPAGLEHVFFGNSGSDANDTAVKLVWLYNNLRGKPGKKKIISRLRAYHGVTVAAGSLTGLTNVHRLFDLPLPMMRHVSAPDRYRLPERTAEDYADELDALIASEGPDSVAAFFAEPVMGTGGVLVPPDGYYQAIQHVLARHDVLLVFDEVISGFGRLGHWFGAQRFGVTPDLMTIAKGLTSSYVPMSGVLVGERVWSVMSDNRAEIGAFGHGFTTSGHPVAAAAALANLDIIARENLVERAASAGKALASALRGAVGDHRLVGDIRSDGLMVGVELVADRAARRNFPPERQVAAQAARLARDEGLLVRALPANDVIAFSPPFTIDEPAIRAAAMRFGAALDRLAFDVEALQ